MSDELVRWLSGCLDAIEETAREAIGDQWHVDGHEVMSDYNGHRTVADAYGNAGMSDSDMRHIALNDPRAILTRVGAERGLVATHRPEQVGDDESDPLAYRCGRCRSLADYGQEDWPCPVLRVVAYGHRYDAAGWEPSWAPDGFV